MSAPEDEAPETTITNEADSSQTVAAAEASTSTSVEGGEVAEAGDVTGAEEVAEAGDVTGAEEVAEAGAVPTEADEAEATSVGAPLVAETAPILSEATTVAEPRQPEAPAPSTDAKAARRVRGKHRPAPQPESDVVTWSAFGAQLLRLWYVIVVCLAVGGGLGYAFSKAKADRYTASATVLVTTSGSLLAVNAISSYAQLVTSDVVLQPVAASLGLTPGTIKHDTTATVPADTNVIDISVSSASGGSSARIANALGRELIAQIKQLSLGNPTTVTTPKGKLKKLKALPVNSGRLITTATAPGSPSSPKPKIDTLIGLVVGLFVGLTVVLLLPFRRRA